MSHNVTKVDLLNSQNNWQLGEEYYANNHLRIGTAKLNLKVEKGYLKYTSMLQGYVRYHINPHPHCTNWTYLNTEILLSEKLLISPIKKIYHFFPM